ncbi:hypothetical protein LCM14_02395 [Priestia aryabhattai]|uniref:hypothetical protein n=1 Tax=Priestia aryabhattai TaxID=412384 RepID=UPI001CD71C34|nr:hypothetical protein [Priestia aryabhattai]MCA1048629.1 hypothetical protein [Priestia aryabhattai]
MPVNTIENYPKSIKKALRYIKQEASLEQLESLENSLLKSIKVRRKSLEKKKYN